MCRQDTHGELAHLGGAGPVLNSHTFLVWLSRGLFKKKFFNAFENFSGIASAES